MAYPVLPTILDTFQERVALMSRKSKTGILDELRPFFYPRSMAVIGVSQSRAGAGTSMVRSLQRFGFRGEIFPINPRIKELRGLPVYASVSHIPGEVDFARVYVPNSMVLEVVKACREKGVKGVEVFTAGFSEMGTEEGKKLEQELASLAGDGMRIIGPNCFGVYSPEGCVTQIAGETYQRKSGSLGFMSQSGGLSADVFSYAADYGLRFSQGISYGNACDINEVDLLEYFEADSNTHIVGAYLEGVKNGMDFLGAARRLAQQKPLVIWKGGLTPSGAKVAATHTGSLAGEEKVWSALFRQTGAVQVHDIEELLDTALAFYHLPPQVDPRVALVCGGGGVGVAFSDSCHREGLSLAKLSREVRDEIAGMLPPLGTSSRNPIDVGPPFPAGKVLERIMEVLAASGQVGSIVLDKVTPSIELRVILGYEEQIDWKEKPWLSDIPVRIAEKYGIPVIVVLREGWDRESGLAYERERKRLRDYYLRKGLGVYPTTERALKALGRMIRYYGNKGVQGDVLDVGEAAPR
jgi:acyl-CoA synthetase (NDP forming)